MQKLYFITLTDPYLSTTSVGTQIFFITILNSSRTLGTDSTGIELHIISD